MQRMVDENVDKNGGWWWIQSVGAVEDLDHRVRRPKPTKSAAMQCKAPAAAQADQVEVTGAGAGGSDD
jgi:hypothetical protein